ncbi:MAG TPA: c-type cytochrome [Vicinamibacterales bacterium]|nr:c-type cytochrome [Vicinamibacterales bacterium]
MRFVSALLALSLGLAVAVASRPVVFAQHETAADLLDGERAYGASCLTCHGPDGNLIAGIDFSRGQLRRQYSDDDLVRIIRTGIPNSPMPATNMTVEQASKIVAYLRSLPTTKRTAAAVVGDAARGKAVYDGKGNCASCHRVDGVGSRVGPDLTRVGQQRRSTELEQSILDPGAEVQPANRFYRVVLRDGTQVTGRLLSHDTFTVQIIDTREQLRSFVKADLREHGFAESPMPSYRGKLSAQELADVVSYLASLKGR